MVKKYVNFQEEAELSQYFKEIRKKKTLTQEEEIELAEKIKTGDQNALNRLVEANLKFVISIARTYQNQGLSLNDLINEGNYGLIKAAQKFDHTKGFKFISYAVWWIKQSIIKSLNENARLVRLPVNVITKLSHLKTEIDKFESENERKPVFGELEDDYLLQDNSKTISLNEKANEDGDELIDMLDNGETTDEIIQNIGNKYNELLKKVLNDTLSILDEREKEIIQSYYGINTEHEAMTLEAIGEKFDLTKERIRQIKKKAIRKLRYNADKLHTLIHE